MLLWPHVTIKNARSDSVNVYNILIGIDQLIGIFPRVNSTKTHGGLKTKDSCRAKYQAVCEFPLHIEYTLTPTLNF